MAKRIDLERRITMKLAENFLERIPGLESSIRLPQSFSSREPFALCALMQGLFTWRKFNQKAVVETHISQENLLEQIDDLSREYCGLSAFLIADMILSKEGGDLTEVALNAAFDRVGSLHKGYFRYGAELVGSSYSRDRRMFETRGRTFLIPVVDDSIFNRPDWLYRNDGDLYGVRNASDFRNMAFKFLRDSNLTQRQISSLNKEDVGDLGKILHELFINTEQWAKTDVCGHAVERSVRGLLVRTYDSVAIRNLSRLSPDNPGLKFSHKISNEHNVSHFIEISIFDSGPGFCSRFHSEAFSENWSAEDEYKALRGCFLRNFSTSGLTHKGKGLAYVMRTLSNLKAMFYVRTGKLAVFRDFISEPLKPKIPDEFDLLSEEETRFRDWKTGSLNPRQNAYATGSVLCALIPVLKNE